MNSPKFTIGLVGEKCGGKETTCKFLEMELGHLYSFAHHRFSDPLAETLKVWRHLEINRENLQKLSPAMREAYGRHVLANEIKHRVLNSDTHIVTLDGLRWKDADVPVLRSLPNNFLIYITAPVEIRYARARLRSMQQGRTSYDGEGDSFDKFLEEEKAITEIEIPEIAQLADFTIDNSSNFDDLRAQIRQFIAEKLQIKL